MMSKIHHPFNIVRAIEYGLLVVVVLFLLYRPPIPPFGTLRVSAVHGSAFANALEGRVVLPDVLLSVRPFGTPKWVSLPYAKEMIIGRYEVFVEPPDFWHAAPSNQTVRIGCNRLTDAVFLLDPEPVSLTMEALDTQGQAIRDAGVDIRHDGRPIGDVWERHEQFWPFVTNRLAIVAPGYRPLDVDFYSDRPGEHRRIRVVLLPPPTIPGSESLSSTTEPADFHPNDDIEVGDAETIPTYRLAPRSGTLRIRLDLSDDSSDYIRRHAGQFWPKADIKFGTANWYPLSALDHAMVSLPVGRYPLEVRLSDWVVTPAEQIVRIEDNTETLARFVTRPMPSTLRFHGFDETSRLVLVREGGDEEVHTVNEPINWPAGTPFIGRLATTGYQTKIITIPASEFDPGSEIIVSTSVIIVPTVESQSEGSAGRAKVIVIELIPIQVTISATAPKPLYPGTDVPDLGNEIVLTQLDGKLKWKLRMPGPWTIARIPAGTIMLAVSHPLLKTMVVTAEVAERGTRIDLSIHPKTGMLRVECETPGAAVYMRTENDPIRLGAAGDDIPLYSGVTYQNLFVTAPLHYDKPLGAVAVAEPGTRARHAVTLIRHEE